ncbi:MULTISPECIES: formate-dependent phosphoribosylglycinamide formyltransferase [unclassified Arsukibacterium]|mgnify:FL=1|uniref:formate-dependent phosphoribosylglycinamide formyltransferase n=1 Tax=unclassified Arsukibacterium TaxID=2635278 RepID=UPI000C64FC0B|nr:MULTISPECIES: formate-dependent phosphoribosylglycinamide formyltransferase [unclassified Arsukibacterium]MAA95956.1 phosphoribosylglycinamide formyltransferase 2 [Rheinheimera sp.]MBM33454.1 phosphoribosylglycinamide formyltransferase 2 [Rheinheimera sp.]|tara:strand:- start:30385 stop:31587 length:1203 start_codon:yes stop_codon:yes gene_type:complete
MTITHNIEKIGTPGTASSTKVLLLGAGELGKELCIELKRYGCEVIAVDRYPNAPAMQVADKAVVMSMLDNAALRQLVISEKPALIVPELEAIATSVLIELEDCGFNVVPSAKAVNLTMNREGIRRLAAEELQLATSPFQFASDKASFIAAINAIGYPCVVKPIMSSSGKGQSVLRSESDIDAAWLYAQEGGRAGKGRVIVEGFIDFDYEITLLTINSLSGIQYCAPIGHRQEKGDYRESWQPQAMSDSALAEAKRYAKAVVEALGGRGLFGVELFIKGDTVYFSEVSPRPHDTGMVTLISQQLSEFALHARAILGLPIPYIKHYGPAASAVLLVPGHSADIQYRGMAEALSEPDTELRIFGKPQVQGERRMGVALALSDTVEAATDKALKVISQLSVTLK